MAHVHKIAISMSKDVLAALDEAVAEAKISRSRFIQNAVRAYLKQQQEDRMQAQINAAFTDPAVREEQRVDSERFLQGQPTPEDAW
jgi:metal-responsive CopG/Arc/MetJ family transcriptional regulator